LEDLKSQVVDLQVEAKKGAGKQQTKQFKNKLGDVDGCEDTVKISAVSPEVGSKLQHSASEASNDTVEETAAKSREGDLRAELSRRRAERLTKVSVYIGFEEKMGHLLLQEFYISAL
jgi:hypothetical protein